MRTDLPGPVLALIDSGRRALAAAPLQHPSSESVSHDVVIEYARRHGMVAWVTGPSPNDAVLAQMARSLEAVQQLLRIVELLQRNGVTAVTLKGPAFSQWLYGDPAARCFSDLDLLVSFADRDRARALLEQAGFRRRIAGTAGDIVYASLGAWQMERADQLEVDLHWRLAGRRFSRALDTGDVLRDAIDTSLGGRPVRVPRPEHTAIITLTHAAKHLWYALELPFSIAALVRRTDIDWQEVRAIAVRAGALRGAAAGLAVAADLFAVDVPSPFHQDLQLPDVRTLCREALAALALPPGIFADHRLERRIHRLCFDRMTDRVVYEVRRTIEPTRAEWEWVALPSALALLYWPTRVVRLALIAMHSGGHARTSQRHPSRQL